MNTAVSNKRLAQCIRENTFISNQCQQYYCACGKSFSSRNHFKDHVLQIHDGLFLKGSSHYITDCTYIVLPVTNWNKQLNTSSYNQRLKNTDVKTTELRKQHQIQVISDSNTLPFQNLVHKSVKQFKNRELKPQRQPMKSMKTTRNQMKEHATIISGISHKIIEWNGFMIIPNQKYKKEGFFCGTCSRQLKNQQMFVLHLLNECLELQNMNSSHFLRLNQDLQKKQKKTNSFQTKRTTLSNPQRKKKYFSENDSMSLRVQYRDNIPLNLMGIFEILSKKVESDKEAFICGCKKICTSQNSIMNHISRMHNQIVPSNSSHIFIRTGSTQHQNYCLRLKVQSQDDDQQIWSCPCQPASCMNKVTFIKHIMSIHKGISPLYKILYFDR